MAQSMMEPLPVFELIQKVKAKVFVVEFFKKDGTLRRMICQFGVRKHLKGGPHRELPDGYVVVWDTQHRGYRTLDTSRVHYFKCGKLRYGKPLKTQPSVKTALRRSIALVKERKLNE